MTFDPPLNAEERTAWDIAFAGGLARRHPNTTPAEDADYAIRSRRERFGDRPGMPYSAKLFEDLAQAAITFVRIGKAQEILALGGDQLVALVAKLDER